MRYAQHDVIREESGDGTIRLRARAGLGPVVARTTDWLDDWAARTPGAVLVAERSGAGWRDVTYAEARDTARAMAAGVLALELTGPIMVISGNSVDHALLTLAAQYAGIPTVPVAEQYAQIPDARGQLDFIAAMVRPGLVFGEDGARLGDVLRRPGFAGARLMASHGAGPGVLTLGDLTREAGAVNSQVTPDTVAKILMTSGSTSSPKGVLTTHRMMCTNQMQLAQALPFLTDRPPRIVDWLPWNHVFGGSHNFNMMMANGGALYIDSGKPTAALFDRTLESLRLQTGTLAFNVPVGYAMLRDALMADDALARAYFSELDMLFYAGASLPQDVWDDLAALAQRHRGAVPLMTTSYGLTETAPSAVIQHEPGGRAGVIGVPVPGIEVKLIPDEDMRCEIRLKGPSVFGGYLNDPDRTAAAFDDEGFFVTGDAVQFVDGDVLRFDGRISEDFKLMTGTWVRAAALRLEVLGALAGLAADVVITGADRGEVGALIVPSEALRAGAAEDAGALRVDGAVIARRIGRLGGSSSTRVARALVLAEPPSLAEGEITAKGNLNTRKLLTRRAALLERLYSDDPSVIRSEPHD